MPRWVGHHRREGGVYDAGYSSQLVGARIGATCDPKFNSFFEVGITTVNCISSDNAGNVARASFDVIITGDPQPLESAIVPQIQMPPMP